MVSNINNSYRKSFLNLLKVSVSSLKNSYNECLKAVNWVIENRGGLAKIAGLAILPAQVIGNSHTLSHIIINKHLSFGLRKGNIEKISIPLGKHAIEGVICYPSNWKKEDKSHCILYHNPNAIAMAEFFERGKLAWTPGEIFKNRNCPIILYDYRGVGLNQDVSSPSYLKFRATYESIVADGQAALKHALSKFHKVEVVGSSLGGGVATVALDRHLNKNPLDTYRIIQLINHDSFTTTSRVALPNVPRIADFLGDIVGGNLDVKTPMKNLINRGVKVTVLCHTKDPVIPVGARMANFIKTLPKKDNVTVFTSPYYDHANLSSDMIDFLYT